jgi:hypothetical protein
MRKFVLFVFIAILLFGLQGCITYSVSITPHLLVPVKQETFIKNFELIFNSNPNAELLETSAGKGNHTYTYSINESFKLLLESWFTQKFGYIASNQKNKIIVSINNIEYSDIRQKGITSFPWTHIIEMTVGIEMQVNENKYQESFTFNKNFLIRGGKQPDDIENNVSILLQTIIASIDEYITLTLKFEQPIDYLNRDFALSEEGATLKSKIMDFIDVLLVESLLLKTNLERRSINLIEFKKEKYLAMGFSNNTVYNSLKSDKYKIAKIHFDEIVRKILSPLNNSISNSELFYGYDINVTTHTQDFLNNSEIPKKIEYRFLMPQEIVKKYKDKDITGQDLLDNSFILMDDERIHLKLQ